MDILTTLIAVMENLIVGTKMFLVILFSSIVFPFVYYMNKERFDEYS